MREWDIYCLAQEWIREAGKRLREDLGENRLQVKVKSRFNDLVTHMDQETERFLTRKIRKFFPDHSIVGEEGMDERPANLEGNVWLIDPIDGTSNFVNQRGDFVISIGFYQEKKGIFGLIYDVMRDELYHGFRGQGVGVNNRKVSPFQESLTLQEALVAVEWALHRENGLLFAKNLLELGLSVRGLRAYGATALALAKVAVGKMNAFITLGTHPWDYGAGRILVEEAGGVVTDFKGHPLPLEGVSSVIASHPNIHEELAARVHAAYYQSIKNG